MNTITLDSTIQPGEPLLHAGIAITPLFPRLDPVADYATLEDALPLGFRVTELDAAGSVPELAVHNPTGRDVLLYDGEELLGAKQNRILNLTVLVAAGSKTVIPVSCVEEGRWAHRSAAFSSAPHAANPELRRRKSMRLMAEPLARGVAQHEVWDAVRSEGARLGVASATGAHSDAYRSHGRELDKLAAAFQLARGQCGAIVAVGESLCLDYLSRPDAFARLYPKLLSGYLLDALGRQEQKPAGADAFLAAVSSATRGAAPFCGPRRRRPPPRRGRHRLRARARRRADPALRVQRRRRAAARADRPPQPAGLSRPMGFAYTIFVGIPYCLVMVTLGLLLCVTIIGIPAGLTCIALGFKGLTIGPTRTHV